MTFATADEREDSFERQIRPLLIERCVECHGPTNQKGGIRLDSREQVLEGTPEIPALVIPANPDASRIFQVILHSEDDVQMPPRKKLTESQIAAIQQWIKAGAVWPQNHQFGHASAVDKDGWRQHWAFQNVIDPPIPQIGGPDWHPIDAFVRHRLQQDKIEPSPLANGSVLVRRLSYALTGLPPSLSDLNAVSTTDGNMTQQWLNDYAEKLLNSPAFGERWARYWLDIARYADTKGYVFREDREYKDAWRFRDWVIRSLNDDMPYDEFLKRQIAADQLSGADDPDQLAAMGFLTLGRRFLNNKHDIIDDRIDVLCRGTMGLTVSCARCHDHKFDPIPTADYYSLYGVFASSQEPNNAPSPLRLVDRDRPFEPFVFVRGSAGNRGERVSRHFLTALSSGTPKDFANGSGRLELAEHIATAENPLTARVAVNRIWLRLFGRGLVTSPSDFGVRTPPPSHPKLLDHLASYFVARNWSRKALIRYITLSHTWRQSSRPRHVLAARDPENRLIAKMPRRRLDFEAFRDSLLAAADRLDQSVGGKSVDITKEPFATRRTLYARIDRQNLPNLFRTFDFASPDNHAAQRHETTVPQQALYQLNNAFVLEMAQATANCVRSAHPDDVPKQVQHLFEQILQRQPSQDEVLWALQFLSTSDNDRPNFDNRSGWNYGRGILNTSKTRLDLFQQFPVFHNGRWGGGESLPDPKLGWCMLTRDGGHPGHGLEFCAVRRWVADRDCTISVSGTLKHKSKQGDGVTGIVLHDGRSLATIHAHSRERRFSGIRAKLKAGEPLDLVANCGANESHDSFGWHTTIVQMVDGNEVRTWESNTDFTDRKINQEKDSFVHLAHVLLLTNEFMFID